MEGLLEIHGEWLKGKCEVPFGCTGRLAVRELWSKEWCK